MVALPIFAQSTTSRGVISAFGEATVPVRPDMARVSVGVVTQSANANDAASRNADDTASVIAAVRSVLGPSSDVRTINYSLNPNYQYPPSGGQPTLTGFTATNIVQAAVNDLGLIGRVIDAGIQAGANRVDSLQLGLKDDEPVRAQALRTAAQKARTKADAIASGLGVRTGAVVAALDGYQTTPITYDRAALGAAPAATATPVEAGTVDVRATVTLRLEVQ